jgi:serine/threonine-protein kinase
MSLPPGARLGSYEVAELIGQGGMGEVYRARDTKLGRDVAVKILPEALAADPDRFARFQREARVLAALNHPHIATLYGFEETAGRFAIVMELVDGPTLATRIADGPLPLEEALGIARQVAAALEAAHDQGVVHRDLKPANVKVKEDGTVKVLDFGLAKAMDAASTSGDPAESPTITSPAMTMQGVILGTAAYMSPEQARGKRVDKRADIWAFGCVLYEMLTAKRVFVGDDVTETIASVVRVEPDLTATPPSVRRLLKRCLEKDPRKRLRDIGDAWDLVDDGPAEAGPMASAGTRRVSPLLIGGLILAGAVLGGAAIWVARTPDVTPPVVTRFAETLPQAAALNIALAVSPDGRAFVFRSAEGGQGWLQRRYLDQLTPLAIGDVMGNDPSFSPDGQWVAYRVGQILKRVSVDGGPSETIATLPSEILNGVAWSDDGTMILGCSAAGLQRVPAGGGALSALTQPDGGNHRFPQSLPGGRAILYTHVAGGAGGSAELMILDLTTGQSKPLLRGSNARYLSSGHLVFFNERTLWAVPFDPSRLETRGAPRAVLAGVRAPASYAVSNTGALVYLPEAASQSRELIWVDRRGTEAKLPIDARAWSNPRVSPDGKLVAMPMRSEGIDVWIWDLAGRSLRQLTSDPMPNYLAAWAHDGKRLAFSFVIDGRAQLHWQAADGSGAPQLIAPKADPRGEFPNGFAKDGGLLYTVGAIDIGVLKTDGSGARRMLVDSPAIERNAAVSPDGRWFAFESNRTGRNEIYVRPYPNAQDGEWKVTRDGGITPVWSRDGKELFYWKVSGPGVSVNAIPITATTVFAFGESLELFTGSYAQTSWDTSYDVAPDGRFLLMKNVGAPAREEVIVVQNWIEELKRLVPVK